MRTIGILEHEGVEDDVFVGDELAHHAVVDSLALGGRGGNDVDVLTPVAEGLVGSNIYALDAQVAVESVAAARRF